MAGTMGRKPSVNLNLPPRMRARKKPGGTYYYYDAGGKPRREIPLGSDYTTAVRKWAALEGDQPSVGNLLTVKDLADRYTREVMPLKAARTMDDNLVELGWLLKFFGNPPAPIDSIQPIHVRQYMDWRVSESRKRVAEENAVRASKHKPIVQTTGKEGQVRANREKALFSHMWNKAREWGITDKPNPCAGIKGFTEAGRNIYIEDNVFEAVWNAACVPLRDALDLAYLTDQRPEDVREMSELDIRNGELHVLQGKTTEKLRIEITGKLDDLIKRIKARKEGYKIHTLALLCTETGRPLTYNGYRARFDKARKQAAKEHPDLADAIRAFQFRDLRAKAGTDKADAEGMESAQKLLGHKNITMTQHYVRKRLGERVKPTK